MLVRSASPRDRARDEVVALLRDYVRDELLDGDGEGLDERTPLLQWGVIDSLAMVGLLAFVEQRLHVRIPDEEVKPEHFQNLGALADLIARLGENPGDARCALERRGVRPVALGPLAVWRTPPRAGRPRWLIVPDGAATEWAVILHNLVGEQEAIALDGAASPDAATTALEQLLAERDEPVVLIGHAAGARAAAVAARARPLAARALVAVAPDDEAPFAGVVPPTLLIGGEHDTAVERVAAALPAARVEWIARCGRDVPVARPQELLLLVNLFLYGRSR